MSKSDYIKISREIIDNFLKPLSMVVDKASLVVSDGKLQASCFNQSSQIMLKYVVDIDTNISERKINIPNLIKLRELLDKATDLECSDSLVVDNNLLKYTSKKWRFKYHLLDDNILMNQQMISDDKIKNYKYDSSFILSFDNIVDIVKSKSLYRDKNVNKVYFSLKDEKLYATITDMTKSNVDDIGVMITDDYTINDDGGKIDFIVYFDLIRILSQHRGVKFKVKVSENSCLIQTIWNGVNINYIIALLRK